MAFAESGTGLLGCASVTLSNGTATCTSTTLTGGGHLLTAQYSGDAAFAISTGEVTQTVTVDIPTLSEWAMLLLGLLLVSLAWQEQRHFR